MPEASSQPKVWELQGGRPQGHSTSRDTMAEESGAIKKRISKQAGTWLLFLASKSLPSDLFSRPNF